MRKMGRLLNLGKREKKQEKSVGHCVGLSLCFFSSSYSIGGLS